MPMRSNKFKPAAQKRWLNMAESAQENDEQSATQTKKAPLTSLWEVFVRSRNGLSHIHVGSVHAADASLALRNARDVYTRRGEGVSVWVVPSAAITASDPADKSSLFETSESKIYRHPTFYEIPDDIEHM